MTWAFEKHSFKAINMAKNLGYSHLSYKVEIGLNGEMVCRNAIHKCEGGLKEHGVSLPLRLSARSVGPKPKANSEGKKG